MKLTLAVLIALLAGWAGDSAAKPRVDHCKSVRRVVSERARVVVYLRNGTGPGAHDDEPQEQLVTCYRRSGLRSIAATEYGASLPVAQRSFSNVTVAGDIVALAHIKQAADGSVILDARAINARTGAFLRSGAQLLAPDGAFHQAAAVGLVLRRDGTMMVSAIRDGIGVVHVVDATGDHEVSASRYTDPRSISLTADKAYWTDYGGTQAFAVTPCGTACDQPTR